MTEGNAPPTTPPPSGPVDYAGAAAIEENKDARTWGMLCHLSGFAGFIIPFGMIIGPLVVWLIKKNEHPFVDDQGKEALNFAITVILAVIASVILMFVLIGFLLLPAVAICWIVFTIIATVKANAGERYRYPFALRLIK
jgi:uncharacterized Tic20 family protein